MRCNKIASGVKLGGPLGAAATGGGENDNVAARNCNGNTGAARLPSQQSALYINSRQSAITPCLSFVLRLGACNVTFRRIGHQRTGLNIQPGKPLWADKRIYNAARAAVNVAASLEWRVFAATRIVAYRPIGSSRK